MFVPASRRDVTKRDGAPTIILRLATTHESATDPGCVHHISSHEAPNQHPLELCAGAQSRLKENRGGERHEPKPHDSEEKEVGASTRWPAGPDACTHRSRSRTTPSVETSSSPLSAVTETTRSGSLSGRATRKSGPSTGVCESKSFGRAKEIWKRRERAKSG